MTVPFSDPSRPGTVKVSLIVGSISVKASSTTKEVIVTSRAFGQERRDRSRDTTGLHRLGQSSGLSVEEDNNVVTVSVGRVRSGDVELEVPVRTNVQLNTVNGRAVVVEGIEGDIEATTVNGSITLTGVSGAVVAHATNGQILATLKQVPPQKPMSFTSLNGSVDVTLPPSVKANLKLRSDQGDVYTDFDVQIQQGPRTTVNDSRSGDGRYRLRIDNSILGTVNGGGPEIELRTFNGSIYLRKAK